MKVVLHLLIFILITHAFDARSSEFFIRPTKTNDLETFVQLSKKIINEDFRAIICAGYPQSPIVLNQELLNTYCRNMTKAFADIFTQEKLQDTHQRLFSAVLADNEQVVGFCFSQQISPDQAYIRYLIVDKQYRNQGIGNVLLQVTLDSYPHITSCELKTFAYGNDAIHRFYEKHGFISNKMPISLQKQYSDYSDTITFVLYHLDIER